MCQTQIVFSSGSFFISFYFPKRVIFLLFLHIQSKSPTLIPTYNSIGVQSSIPTYISQIIALNLRPSKVTKLVLGAPLEYFSSYFPKHLNKHHQYSSLMSLELSTFSINFSWSWCSSSIEKFGVGLVLPLQRTLTLHSFTTNLGALPSLFILGKVDRVS